MSLNDKLNKILIIDFGSQFTQLIARRVRELGVYSEIISNKNFKNNLINVQGIILSGGPLNVNETKKIQISEKVLKLKIPILGICFGHQVISKQLGGKVKKAITREFGLVNLKNIKNSILTKNFFKNKKNYVWMSHADKVTKLPKGFDVIASTKNSKFTIIKKN